MTETEVVRVIAYIPIHTNQLLQAHASLEGKAKQTLIGEILTEHAETLQVATLNKESKPTKRKASKRVSSNKRKLETTESKPTKRKASKPTKRKASKRVSFNKRKLETTE